MCLRSCFGSSSEVASNNRPLSKSSNIIVHLPLFSLNMQSGKNIWWCQGFPAELSSFILSKIFCPPEDGSDVSLFPSSTLSPWSFLANSLSWRSLGSWEYETHVSLSSVFSKTNAYFCCVLSLHAGVKMWKCHFLWFFTQSSTSSSISFMGTSFMKKLYHFDSLRSLSASSFGRVYGE